MFISDFLCLIDDSLIDDSLIDDSFCREKMIVFTTLVGEDGSFCVQHKDSAIFQIEEVIGSVANVSSVAIKFKKKEL